MIALICLLVPPLLMVWQRERVFRRSEDPWKRAVHYLFSVLGLNFLMLVILSFGFGSRDNVFGKLNQYNVFAIKYICLSVLLAVAEPYGERFLREKVKIHVQPAQMSLPHCPARLGIFLSLYALVLFGLNFIRIFDNNFWGDEAYSANLVRNSLPGIIAGTAADVHPPLYYLFLRASFVLFGNQGWAFHLVSLLPYGIILALCLTVFRKRFGTVVSVIVMTIAGLSGNAVVYNMEVRMYSWGALFVLLSFYELYGILCGEKIHNYVLFTIFSLAAAYTHYYCLLSVAFFYMALLALSLFGRRLRLARVLACCLVTAAGYLPWLFVLLKTVQRVESNYWITEIHTVGESIGYLFSNQFKPALWILILLGGVFLYCTRQGFFTWIRRTAGGSRCHSLLQRSGFPMC